MHAYACVSAISEVASEAEFLNKNLPKAKLVLGKKLWCWGHSMHFLFHHLFAEERNRAKANFSCANFPQPVADVHEQQI